MGKGVVYAALFDNDGEFVGLQVNGEIVDGIVLTTADVPLEHPQLGTVCFNCLKPAEQDNMFDCACSMASYCGQQCRLQHRELHATVCSNVPHVSRRMDEEEEDEGTIAAPGGAFRGRGGVPAGPPRAGRPGGFPSGRAGGFPAPTAPRRAIAPTTRPSIMPRRPGGPMAPRTAWTYPRWGRPWRPSFWSRIIPGALWPFWDIWFRHWYPENYYYVPRDYYYSSSSRSIPLPNLNRPDWRFRRMLGNSQAEVNAKAREIEDTRLRILQDPEVADFISMTGFNIAPDVQQGIFVWISENGRLPNNY